MSQRLGDFLVRQAEGELPEHFAFALGQRHFHVGRQPRRRQRAGDAPQLVARPGVSPGGRLADGSDQFRRGVRSFSR